MEEKKPLLERMKDDLPDGVGKEGIEEKISKIEEELEAGLKKIEDRENEIEKLLETAEVFEDSLKEIEEWMPEATKESVLEEPIGWNEEIVSKQQDELKVTLFCSYS